MKTVQLLGSTTLARVALPWFLERAGARVVALDPGEEDEARPWFAPVRGLCHELGVPLGRRDAEHTIDLDPDARRPGPGLRLCGPKGVTPDFCRALLPRSHGAAGWSMVYGDGARLFAATEVQVRDDDDGPGLRDRATLRGIEALAGGGEGGSDTVHPEAAAGRFRSSEALLLWDQPADVLLARVRALHGPYGGARTHIGDTPVAIESAELASGAEAFPPGTVVDVDHGMIVACGRGAQGPTALRILALRPSWRPLRRAAEFAAAVGIGVGYQLV